MPRLNILSLFIKGFYCCLALQIALAEALPMENQYGPVQPGDILWNIALKTRPEINRYQMMLALFQTNPAAFKIPCNLNSLIIGKMLRIPTMDEIQTVPPTEAKRLIDQQNAEWKNYRQQGQVIRCASSPVTVAPAVERVSTPPPQTVKPIPPTTETKIISKPPVATILPQPATRSWPITERAFWVTLLNHPLSLPVIMVIVALLLSPVILISRLWRRHHKLIAEKSAPPNDFTERRSPSLQLFKTLKVPPVPIEPATVSESSEVMVHQKLDKARECLAKGETQTAKILLQDIIEQGHQNQRREARQLLEINQQMSTLELNLSQIQQMTTRSAKAEDEVKIVTPSQESVAPATPTHLPESKTELFHLVDKIFTVLDQELNAKGQLIAAYHQRHQPELFSADECKTFKKPEKVLVEQAAADTFEHPLREAKTIRYL